ncbi:MAG TPA: GntR family transcriptional regulator [Acidimicrobiales bacterium]|nr:GntR family transcriptional regulator [Acidimicrobiales bacterium]
MTAREDAAALRRGLDAPPARPDDRIDPPYDDSVGRLDPSLGGLGRQVGGMRSDTTGGASGPARAGSARARVYAWLRRAIVLCEITPGRALSENELAAALGVSRTPVREALQQLADDGLVVVRPQQGTATSLISSRQVREAQFVRELLERSALQLACQRARPMDLEPLDDLLVVQRRAAERRDFAEFFDSDHRLHRALIMLSGFEGLVPIAETARAHLDRIRALTLPESTTMQRLLTEHSEVVEHVRSGDAGRADGALRAHLRAVLSDLPVMRARYPAYFESEPDDGAGIELSGLAVALQAPPTLHPTQRARRSRS